MTAQRGRPKKYLEDRKTVSVRLPMALHERLWRVATERDTTINHLMVRAATTYLDNLPPLGP